MASGSYVSDVGAPIGQGVYDMSTGGWAIADARASSAFAAAQAMVAEMGSFTIPFEAVTSGFTPPAIGYTLSIPSAPSAPSVSFPTLAAPDPLSLAPIDTVTPGAIPEFTESAPFIAFLNQPESLSATPPGDAPTVADVTLPDAPVIVFPDDPVMELLSLPAAPTLDIPTFSAIAPDGSAIYAPSAEFIWSEDYYDSALLQDVTARLTDMLTGGTGLPAAIEQAIWSRGRAREDVLANKAVQETVEGFAARGFTLPTGAMAMRLAEVTQKNREASGSLSRDISIEQAKMEVENMKFTVSTGIQLVGQLMTYSGQYAARALDAARATVDVAINLFNAQVALYNSRLQSYQTEASVYKDLMQAEALRLEQYRTEIEAQKLIGEINVQSIQVYSERINALMSAVELYKAQLDGVRTSVEVDKVRIEGFRETVNSYKALVDAKTSEYDAWGKQIQGEVAKIGVYESQAKVYGTLVDAYKTGETVKIENMKSQIAGNEMLVSAFGAKVNYLSEQIKAAVAQVDTGVKIYDGQARVYQSQVSGEVAKASALAEQIRLIMAAGSTDAELKLKAADINIQQLLRIALGEQEGKKAAGMVAGQLAASSMSAFNLGSHVSASWGTSISNSLNESHSFSGT